MRETLVFRHRQGLHNIGWIHASNKGPTVSLSQANISKQHAPVDGRVAELVGRREPWHGLQGDFYRDDAIFQAEIDQIWKRGWLFACHSCEIGRPGDYVTLRLQGDALIVVRDGDGKVRAFWNTCRHRGAELCSKESGHATQFVCPYHQWVYDQDGGLVACRGMQDDVEKSQLGLFPAPARELEGLVYVSFCDDPPDFSEAAEYMGPFLQPQRLGQAKVAKTIDYQVEANWKLVWENNRECYHCTVNHPEYIKANFDHYDGPVSARVREKMDTALARNEEAWREGGLRADFRKAGLIVFPDVERNWWFSANRTVLADGFVTESLDGSQVAPLMGDYGSVEVGTLRVRTVPNMWNHSSCDHAVTTRLLPVNASRTLIRVTWLVDQAAEEGRDYDLERLLPFWQRTSEQDWDLCERSQRGVVSSRYRPGPLSKVKESNLESFFVWYLRQLQRVESH